VEDALEPLLPTNAAGSVGVEEELPVWVFDRPRPPARRAVAVAPRPEERLEDEGPRLVFTVRDGRLEPFVTRPEDVM
jgi:hypothetical protein